MEMMKAVRLQSYGGPEQLIYEDIPRPHPGEGEVLVRVLAAAITPTEFTWIGADRPVPVVLGHELSGIVAAVGPGVSGVAVGEAVYGLTDFARDGAQAEYTLARPTEMAAKPRTIDHVHAAEVPISALTAWQALFDHAQLAAGQRVLIHGATGGVGSFAVQLAHRAGAHVIATTSTRNMLLARELGSEDVVNYETLHCEIVVRDVDLVLDTVGGEVQERSWNALKPEGMLLSIVSPPSEVQAAAHGVRSAFFIVEPNRSQLVEIGRMLDAGTLRPLVEAVYPLAQVRVAYAHAQAGHIRGKVVLHISDE